LAQGLLLRGPCSLGPLVCRLVERATAWGEMRPFLAVAGLLLPAGAAAGTGTSSLRGLGNTTVAVAANASAGAGTAGSTSAASDCAAWGCEGGCGSCFNAGARDGVMCNAGPGSIGYYCPADPSVGGVSTFACMDWTFGSTAMHAAEASFNRRENQNVFFGVGTYGISADEQRGLGACYRLKVEGVDRDIIAQSVNTGHDVAGNQFDIQMGAGGAGAYNTCAGGLASMFPGELEPWGCQYGGVDSRDECNGLPEYPRQGDAMRQAGDSLVELCKYGWDHRLRISGAGKPAGRCRYNPTLLDVARVRCPDELALLTQMQRLDDPDGYEATSATRPVGFPNTDKAHECRAQEPGAGVDYCLTRMMDCRKPSGAFIDNVRPELMAPGRKVVQTCTGDGYTRINVQCGCIGCYC